MGEDSRLGWIALQPPVSSPAIHSRGFWAQLVGESVLFALQPSPAIHPSNPDRAIDLASDPRATAVADQTVTQVKRKRAAPMGRPSSFHGGFPLTSCRSRPGCR